MALSTPSLTPGTTLAGFRIERLLGRGGMGAVYLAHQIRLRRMVALKVLLPELANNEEFRARFIRESRLAASLEHPAVIPIYDADEREGLLYLAMRYISGRDLKTLLREEPLSPERALELIEPVASALDAAHAVGLIHRDVKPANILVEESSGRTFLSDFGVAKSSSSTPCLLSQSRRSPTKHPTGRSSWKLPRLRTGSLFALAASVHALALWPGASTTDASV